MSGTEPVWSQIPVETILKACYGGSYSPTIESAIANILQLKDYKIDLANACIVDFFVTLVWWCKDKSLSPEHAGVVIDTARKELCNIKSMLANISKLNVQPLCLIFSE